MTGARRPRPTAATAEPHGSGDGARPDHGARLPRFLVRGQPAALAAVERMLAGGAPHALLLVGPTSVGKTTLALDLAAGLLCGDPGARPCRACRICRLVARGSHQDLHRLAPEGPGRQVRIGDPGDPEPGTIRHLLRELARRPVEGAHRVAIVEEAHRMNEDAQNALLKTLEEPPPGVTVILCAEAPERLLPTIRSRAAMLRLGPVATRAIEELLADHGVDAPRAARLARLSGGRPGLALAYAAAPAAVAIREEIARSLVDLLAADRSARLVAGRELLARAAELSKLAPARIDGPGPGPAPAPDRAVGRTGVAELDQDASSPSPAADPERAVPGDDGDQERVARATPAARRLAAWTLLDAWTSVARDLAVASAGGRSRLRDLGLLEEYEAAAARIRPGEAGAFLDRLNRTAALLEANGNPELAVDVLALAWPHVA